MESKEKIAKNLDHMPAKLDPMKRRKGRPIAAEKKSIEVSIEGDYVTIKIPRKDLTKKLLAELI